jgi:transcriptional regulator with XRE-family HTH domain
LPHETSNAMVVAMDVPTKASGLLRAWRELRGLSQDEAAEMVGATQGAWWSWEHGKKRPEADFMFEIERLTRGKVKARDWCLSPAVLEARRQARSRSGKLSGKKATGTDD